MAEALSFGAGIASSLITLLDTSVKAFNYLKAFRDAPEEGRDVIHELKTVQRNLEQLRKAALHRPVGDSWLQALRSEEIDVLATQIVGRLAVMEARGRRGGRSFFRRMQWIFEKEEMQAILGSIHRMNVLLQQALLVDA